MRHLISFLAVSADGFHADADRDLAWQTFGEEFADFSVEQLDEVDTLVLGRRTYEELRDYWTGDLGPRFDPRIAERMNARAKLVVSRTLDAVDWLDSDVALTSVSGLAARKDGSGGDAVVLGSSSLTAALLDAGLVDELRLIVNPILLGDGLRALTPVPTTPLELLRVRPFTAGTVLLYYRPLVGATGTAPPVRDLPAH